MLTTIEARNKGVRACMEKIGYDFCIANKKNSASAYSENDGIMFCFAGVDDNPVDDSNQYARFLASLKGFPYYASCNVDMNDGSIEYLEFVSYKQGKSR
jgi:hypothetical protein